MLQKLEVFSSVPRPPSHIKVIKSKWVFRTKSNGAKKARLTAKGFMQRFGVNYNETFAPVVNTNTVRLVIALAASLNLSLYQLDVKSAFLNATLQEDIYMEKPEFYQDADNTSVFKLNKSLYGLKQAPREWYTLLSTKLLELGYTKTLSDPCFFFKHKPNNLLTLIPFHVDDLKIASNDAKEVQSLEQGLSDSFELSTVSDNRYLGIDIIERNHDITLCQSDFITELLEEHNLLHCRTVNTPLTDNDLPDVTTTPDPLTQHTYRSMVGSLLFVANNTRPDICYATNYLARFMHGPTEVHLNAAKHVLRYLAGTINYHISYKRGATPSVLAYSDSSWSDPIDGRSTSGFVITLANSPIMWASHRQSVPALSSCEAEYMGLSTAAQSILWLRALISELGFSFDNPTPLHGDNQAANLLARNPSSAARTKHINVRFFFLQYHVERKDITIIYLPTSDMIADLFTKALSRVKHTQHTQALLQCSPTTPKYDHNVIKLADSSSSSSSSSSS
jgi:histone deacetylase 1/2